MIVSQDFCTLNIITAFDNPIDFHFDLLEINIVKAESISEQDPLKTMSRKGDGEIRHGAGHYCFLLTVESILTSW